MIVDVFEWKNDTNEFFLFIFVVFVFGSNCEIRHETIDEKEYV